MKKEHTNIKQSINNLKEVYSNYNPSKVLMQGVKFNGRIYGINGINKIANKAIVIRNGNNFFLIWVAPNTSLQKTPLGFVRYFLVNFKYKNLKQLREILIRQLISNNEVTGY